VEAVNSVGNPAVSSQIGGGASSSSVVQNDQTSMTDGDNSVDLVSILLTRFTKQHHTWSDKLIVTKVRITIRLIKFSVYFESKSQTERLNYSPE